MNPSMTIIDLHFGPGGVDELIVDETAGTMSFELKAQVMGTAQDFKFNIGLKDILTAIEAGLSNQFAKWALGLLISLL